MVWVGAKRNPIVHLVELVQDDGVQVNPVHSHIAYGAGTLYYCPTVRSLRRIQVSGNDLLSAAIAFFEVNSRRALAV